MPYVNVPNDLSKIKTKIAFNLTKRQLICFGMGAAIGVPTYLLTRQAIGNTGALFAMLAIMLPAFLLATKGHPKRQAADIHQFIISPIEAHSKKPDETRDKIVALMGNLPRVELFARQTAPGWDVWGNEVKPTIPDFGTSCPKLEVTD